MSEAVVMAAGEGRRLWPFTERWAKPVLPIGGRPVIASLLRELRSAGILEVTIVTGHLAEQVEGIAGDGSAFDLELRFVRQPLPEGSADAVRRALAGGARPPVLIVAADTVFTTDDVASFADAFAARGTAGALALRRGLAPTAHKPGVAVSNGLVERVHVLDSSLPYTSAPLWALAEELVRFLEHLPGPPFELKDAYQRAIDAGLEVAAVQIGPTRDLTFPLDLVSENFPYLPRE